MTAARQVIAGRTYMITRRCTQRQLLLRPDADSEQIYLYCLAEAVERYGVILHGFVAMSNHQHILVRDVHANFPDFLAHLNKMIAKAMNVLRDRVENFWATEQPNALYLVKPSDGFAKLVYLLANPVKDHLVEHVSDWPGACSFALHVSGQPKSIRKPRIFFRRRGKMPDEVTLRVERLDGFESMSDDEWRAHLLAAVREEEQRARHERMRTGRRILGRKGVLRAKPTDLPKRAEPRGGFKPEIACASLELRLAAIHALRSFRERRCSVFEKYRDGAHDAPFPFGTFRVRGLFVVAPAPDEAIPPEWLRVMTGSMVTELSS